MTELADVFRRFGEDYKNAHGAAMLPSHHGVISSVINCRTEVLGGHMYRCNACEKETFSYRSCGNRHCPKCHTGQIRQWLERRQAELLPSSYFHVTITIPKELHKIFRSNQKDCYSILMRAAAEAIKELAADRRYCGGMVGIMAVLHTWTQLLLYHPHVHCLVTGGGVSGDGRSWLPARQNFFIPIRALSPLVRGKVMATIQKERPDINLPRSLRKKKWVTHCKAWGEGQKSVLEYLARYTFRIAITNRRITAMDDQTVSFQHKDRKADKWRTCTLSGMEFMRRFLQHVLPKGFHKIRYSGLWHPTKRNIAKQVRILFQLETKPATSTKDEPVEKSEKPDSSPEIQPGSPCPLCENGTLILVRRLSPKWAKAP